MKQKPDYQKFYEIQSEREKLGIPFSLNDLIKLAFECYLPIPKNIIEEGRVRRDDLVKKLADYWRIAENSYLETGSDTLKEKVKKIQNKLHLNEHEIKLLDDLCRNEAI